MLWKIRIKKSWNKINARNKGCNKWTEGSVLLSSSWWASQRPPSPQHTGDTSQGAQFNVNLHLQEIMFPYLFLLRFSSSLAVSQDAVCPSGSACKRNSEAGFKTSAQCLQVGEEAWRRAGQKWRSCIIQLLPKEMAVDEERAPALH